MPVLTAEQLADFILLAVHVRHTEALLKPIPPPWPRLEFHRDYGDREFGPEYKPWLFEPIADDEAGRRRVLRYVRKLEAEGLLELFCSPFGKIERLRLTEAGTARVRAQIADEETADGMIEEAESRASL